MIGLLLVLSALGETVQEGFPPPEGFSRISGGSFGQYLLHMSLATVDEPVKTYQGESVGHNARVIDLPLVSGDLQQCADSILRVRSEWQRQQGEAEISYHATSGDPIPWSRYQAGERPYVDNNKIAWKSSGQPGSWEGWLSALFTWAGTISLKAYETAPVTSPLPGDILVESGSPGHAVLIMDVAKRGDETILLVAEGYMPAQSFHLELGPQAGWWSWAEEGLRLPHWHMNPDSLRRFKTK